MLAGQALFTIISILVGAVRSTDLSNDQVVDSLEGSPLRINLYKDGETVTINGKVISSTDIETSNGIIHVVDDVIFPFAERSIPEVVTNNSSLSTLLTALETANLVGALEEGASSLSVRL